MVRWLFFLFTVVSCAFPAPPAPTVVDRAPFPPRPGLDRPFVVAVPVTGYELARFGFGTAVKKSYDAHKVLGYYLLAYDWSSGTFAGRTFWEGRGASNGRDVADEPSGPRYVLGPLGWSGLDPATGVLTTGTFPPGSEPAGQVTADGRVVLASRPEGYPRSTTLRTYSLTTGQFVGQPVTLPADRDQGDVQMHRTKLGAGRFWINTGHGQVYRYDPQTQELVLAASEAIGSDHSLALLGTLGTSFLVSRYLLGPTAAQPTPAEVLVIDAAGPTVLKTVTLTLPQGGWVSQGIEVQGTFYLLVSLPWDAGTGPVQQLWSFDPAGTGTGTNTGLALPLWGDGEALVRDQRILCFSTMTKTNTLSVGTFDLSNHTATIVEQSLVQAVQP